MAQISSFHIDPSCYGYTTGDDWGDLRCGEGLRRKWSYSDIAFKKSNNYLYCLYVRITFHNYNCPMTTVRYDATSSCSICVVTIEDITLWGNSCGSKENIVNFVHSPTLIHVMTRNHYGVRTAFTGNKNKQGNRFVLEHCPYTNGHAIHRYNHVAHRN